MSIEGQIEKLIAKYNRDPSLVPNIRAYLMTAARIGAELEREECAVALENRGGCFYGNCAEAARGIRARGSR